MPPKYRVGLIAFVVCLVIDQVTKWVVNANIAYADRIPVIEGFFYLTHVRNPGAAFSLFADGDPTVRLWFFFGVTAVAIMIILSFFRQIAPGDRLSALALGFILGGAIGNLIDRIAYREVIDFLHFKLWANYSWPDFNFADSFIVIGVGILILEMLASEGESRARAKPDESPH